MPRGFVAGAHNAASSGRPRELVRAVAPRILASMTSHRILCLLFVSVALLAVACSDGGDDVTVGTPLPHSPIPAATYDGPTTGIPEVDVVIAAAAMGDEIKLAATTGFSLVPCETEPSAELPSPACRAGEDEGTEVEVLASLTCTRAWVRPEQAPDIYREAIEGSPRTLSAVYRPVPGQRGIEADVVVVVATSAADAAALYVRAGRVVAVEQPCDGDAAALSAADRVAGSIYPAPPP